MSTRPTSTLFARTSRAISGLNWEMHVLQSGLHTFALKHPWLGLPSSLLLLAVVWSLYWIALPALLTLGMVAFVIRPIELRLRRTE
jgi:hypothetical protein